MSRSTRPAHRNRLGLSTRSVHPKSTDPWEGAAGDSEAPSLSPPIYHTSTFRLSSARAGAKMSLATHPTLLYTRWGNPTTRRLERAVASLEGGEDALATASGMAAITVAVFTVIGAGDHVVAGRTLYAATEELFTRILPRFGVRVTFVDPRDATRFLRAIGRRTRLLYVETPSNPTLELTDIAAVSAVGRARGIPVFVDGTFASPFNQSPLALGADVSLHSSTKYIGGHADVTGGLVVGSRAFIERAWKTVKIFGPAASPLEAWLLLRGLRTFALRLERHNANALALAQFLEGHSAVERVHYPGLPSHPQHALARRQMRGGTGMLSFEIRGGIDAGRRFVESVEVATLAVSLGGVETLVEHPATMTHGMLSREERARGGVRDSLIRVSVGIEDRDDLLADFAAALNRARRQGHGTRTRLRNRRTRRGGRVTSRARN